MKSPIRSVLAVLTLAAGLACAGNLKATLVASHATLEQAYNAADDSELRLCYGTTDIDAFTPAQLVHCTAGTPGLTDALHQQISSDFKQAYAAQQRVGVELKTWKVGDPIPTDLTSALALAQHAEKLGAAISPSAGQSAFAQNLQKWIDGLQGLVDKFGGK